MQVEIDLECTRDASRFDLVHLFNFATPDLTRMQAENAHAAGTPFVVTTLNEDIPSFHDQSIRVADVLKEYVRRGQDQAWYASNVVELTKIPGCQPFDNTWTANTAAALFTGGATETASILRQTPTAKTVEIPLGFEQSIHVIGSAFES